MHKEIVVTGITNKIQYATTNGKGLITGNREDITDPCINAVYEHLKTKFNLSETEKDRFGYKFKDGGKLLYFPPQKEEGNTPLDGGKGK